jgi:hypothetical protein
MFFASVPVKWQEAIGYPSRFYDVDDNNSSWRLPSSSPVCLRHPPAHISRFGVALEHASCSPMAAMTLSELARSVQLVNASSCASDACFMVVHM